MLKHSDDSKHYMHVKKFSLCPIPTCRNAVTRKRLTEHLMDLHQKMHIRLGHLANDTNFVPIEVPELRPHSDQPLFSQILLRDVLDLIDESEDEKSFEEQEPLETEEEDVNIEDDDFKRASNPSEIDEEEYNEWIFGFREDQVPSVSGSGILSKEHRLRILEQNTARWSLSPLLRVFQQLIANEPL